MPKTKKFYERSALAKILAGLRRRGKRIVFTNGVYDLIHAGHVTLLEKSKKLGDVLVLGINSDASVHRLKGPKRPIATQADRILVLSALAPVDYIALFNEDTPYDLIQALKPDILVKGGDYKADQIVGRELVKKVVRVPLVEGRSTSNIIKKILAAYAPQ